MIVIIFFLCIFFKEQICVGLRVDDSAVRTRERFLRYAFAVLFSEEEIGRRRRRRRRE